VLDGGAACVKVPYVESAEQARRLVGATKFRPFKGRRLTSLLDGEQPPGHVAEYLGRFNENHSLLLNVESVAGLEALDEILSVPGVDGIVVGPHDLTCSLDAPEDYRGSAFDASVRDILSRCRDAGVSAGVHAHHPDCLEDEIAWAEAGANLIIHSGDLTLFRQHLAKDLARLRHALGDCRGEGDRPAGDGAPAL
jgi:4-hydroxy-2-oxoheptanedioate aldolase